MKIAIGVPRMVESAVGDEGIGTRPDRICHSNNFDFLSIVIFGRLSLAFPFRLFPDFFYFAARA
jgi:hypothetical protein